MTQNRRENMGAIEHDAMPGISTGHYPMKFEEWFNTMSIPESLDPEFYRRLAMSAWDAAIEAATALVEERFDECEPWLLPDDVMALKS